MMVEAKLIWFTFPCPSEYLQKHAETLLYLKWPENSGSLRIKLYPALWALSSYHCTSENKLNNILNKFTYKIFYFSSPGRGAFLSLACNLIRQDTIPISSF